MLSGDGFPCSSEGCLNEPECEEHTAELFAYADIKNVIAMPCTFEHYGMPYKSEI